MTGKVRQIAQRVISFYRVMAVFGIGYLVGGIVVASLMVGGTAAILAVCR